MSNQTSEFALSEVQDDAQTPRELIAGQMEKNILFDDSSNYSATVKTVAGGPTLAQDAGGIPANRALAAPPAMPTTSISGEGMFTAAFMGSGAYIASPVPRLVRMEVVEAFRSALRQRSNVTVMRIKTVVDVAIKAVMTMKPRTSSKKYSTNKPIGPIVTVRSTVIWGVVKISVRAHRSRPNIYADGNLRRRHGCTA